MELLPAVNGKREMTDRVCAGSASKACSALTQVSPNMAIANNNQSLYQKLIVCLNLWG
jgi:hypothetical protein